MNRCPYCNGLNGYVMTQTIIAEACGDWGVGYREVEEMQVVKEKDYRCADCGEPVRNYLKNTGLINSKGNQ